MKLQLCLAAVLLALPSVSYAFNFSVTQAEFNSWDWRCKKAYAGSGSGRSSGYYSDYTQKQLAEASRFGEAAGAAWHYCAGVILMQRAVGSIGQERVGHLNRAVNEIRFTVNKIQPEHQWYPEIHVDYARAHYLNDKKIEAFGILQRLITSHPKHSLPYTAMAFYLKRENQLETAITVLKSAPPVLLEESAELNYFISWYLLDAGKVQDALPFAQKAYKLNYPVPALRQRLASMGHSL